MACVGARAKNGPPAPGKGRRLVKMYCGRQLYRYELCARAGMVESSSIRADRAGPVGAVWALGGWRPTGPVAAAVPAAPWGPYDSARFAGQDARRGNAVFRHGSDRGMSWWHNSPELWPALHTTQRVVPPGVEPCPLFRLTPRRMPWFAESRKGRSNHAGQGWDVVAARTPQATAPEGEPGCA